MLAAPPCARYSEFLTRLSRIEKNGPDEKSSGNPELDDISFLRWSKDFLAAVVAPATIETIWITREYTSARAERALRGWRLRGPGAAARTLGKRITIEDDRFKGSASRLVRTVVWLEYVVIFVTIYTVMLSAWAMVGRSVLGQQQEAAKKFQELTKSADDDYGSLLRLGRAHVYVAIDRPDHSCPVHMIDWAARGTDETTVSEKLPSPFVEGRPAETAWNLVVKCHGVQQALIQLITENIRLTSWENLIVSNFPLNQVIGWNDPMIDRVGAFMNDKFCRSIAQSYQERFDDYGTSRGCPELVRQLAQDSGSVASSALAFVTTSILPCLYAFIGAAAASMMAIRRRTDSALLSYTDRSRIKLNAILGFVFGAVIGLFAGHLSLPADGTGNALGLSALALLTGYNVPAVSDFLDDLSTRLFRPQERNAAGARAA
jgi:hypothetical protein